MYITTQTDEDEPMTEAKPSSTLNKTEKEVIELTSVGDDQTPS